MKNIAFGLIALTTSAGLGQSACAAVTETFSFSNGPAGWFTGNGISQISGQFTGTVEPNGFIELADLTDLSITAIPTALHGAGLSSLSFFSYDTVGGASTLAIIASGGGATACIGAPAALSPVCNPADQPLPASTKAIIIIDGFFFDSSPNFSTVTLVPTPAPEPPAWAMLLLGFAGLGFALRSRAMFATALGLRRKGAELRALSPPVHAVASASFGRRPIVSTKAAATTQATPAT